MTGGSFPNFADHKKGRRKSRKAREMDKAAAEEFSSIIDSDIGHKWVMWSVHQGVLRIVLLRYTGEYEFEHEFRIDDPMWKAKVRELLVANDIPVKPTRGTKAARPTTKCHPSSARSTISSATP